MPHANKNKGGLNIGGQNVKGNVYNNQGGYNDQRVRNVHNTYGDQNRYYTDYNDQYYDYSTNHNGDHYAPATHYHAPVNNVQRGQIVTGTVNGGNFFKPKMRDYNNQAQPEGGNPPRPAAPAGTGYDQYPPPHLPQGDTEGYQAWMHQQQGPPPGFPPRGPQGYPPHPPQNPNYGPTDAPFRPPRQQRQTQSQQQRRQGPEQWAGQYAFEQGRAHLKQNSPASASWDTNGSGDSDTSDEDEFDSDEEPMGNAQRVEHPDRPDQAWIHRGPPQPTPDQFAPERQQRRRAPPPAPPVAAYDDYYDDTDINDLLSSLSLDKKKKKREGRNPKK